MLSVSVGSFLDCELLHRRSNLLLSFLLLGYAHECLCVRDSFHFTLWLILTTRVLVCPWLVGRSLTFLFRNTFSNIKTLYVMCDV